MDALVTGATGFIGSHLVEHLVERGHQVRALALPGDDVSWLDALGVEVARGDIRQADAVQRAVAGCRHVYHLAGRTASQGGSRGLFEAINVGGTRNVAQAALDAGVERMVQCSTGGVYGFVTTGRIDERRPLRPNSPYRSTKAAAEALVQAYRQRHGLPVVTARFASVIGARATDWRGLFGAVERGGFQVIGPGENVLPLCPVGDLVTGLRLCAETPGVEGETFLLAGREPITLRRFLAAIAEALGVAPPVAHRPAAPFRLYCSLASAVYQATGREMPRAHGYALFLASGRYDLSKARQVLGYRPETPLADAIQEAVGWYRRAPGPSLVVPSDPVEAPV
ncbi:NAD-dependent epimerase/dehydratase family protein [Rubrivirga sp. IMCC43871]|uniref:NAD-dependent epimerase/dehydratase family protein n=1 Tax=Rubrivirga sp. IMCC43871 TaxID=3391575 RepID=UPI00398FC9F7